MSLTEQQLTLDGLPVRCLRAGAFTGDAVPLLLLHGAVGGASLCWEPVLGPLAESYPVIAPDLPGFGGSAPLPAMRTQSLLAWLERLLAALDVPQAVLIGSSLGALLARLYAASQPERVRALVLVNGGTLPSVPPAMRRVARQPIVGRAVFHLVARSTLTPVELRRAVKSPSVLSADFLAQARVSAGAFSELMRAFAAGDLPPQRTPAQSTLLLWGADDQVNTLAEAERIKNAIPGAALIPVSDCGLLPQHEAPDVFVWQITRFLTNLDRPARPDLPGVSLLQT